MNEQELRQQIIDACLYLKKTGLIARTWGNVSARLNENEFIITPSGLDYELTKPEDLVIVNISDCSYNKEQRKPSSEKLVHAAAYKARPDVNFIIHTHQLYASAICADEASIRLSDNTFVPCADYGLPSTSKLEKNCAKEFDVFKTENMFLMAKHGVVVFGETMQEALDRADLLEKECKVIFDKRVKEFIIPENMKPYLDDYAQMFPLNDGEDEEAIKMVKEKNAAAQLYAINSKPLSFIDAKLQHLIYKAKYSKLRGK